jgi:hypothetical protein
MAAVPVSWVDTMQEYRIYKLESENRVAAPPLLVVANDAQEAFAKARQMVDGHALEVWDKYHFLGRVEPKSLLD